MTIDHAGPVSLDKTTASDTVPTPPVARRSRIGRTRGGLASLWRRDAVTVVWTLVLLVMILISAFGPFFLRSPSHIDPAARLQGPSGKYWFGTDEYGRDLFSRVVSAGRVSLGLGILITFLAIFFGTLIGTVAGFYTRSAGVLMRLMDAIMAFPAIVLAIALVISLNSGIWSEIIALGVVFIPYVARVVRSRVLTLRERTYVTAARAAGVSGPKILLTHILPNAAPAILVQGVFVYASALLADASLSFLGLGVQPPTPTWGNIVGEARSYISLAPGFIIFPGAAIVISVMALNMAGEGVRGLIDPQARAVLELERVRKLQVRRTKRLAAVRPTAPTPATTRTDGANDTETEQRTT